MIKILEKLFGLVARRQMKVKELFHGGEQKTLESRVEEGTFRAVKEYGEVFRKLAQYDRL